MVSFKEHIKHTALLAYPVSIGQLGHIMMGVVDSLMVGKVGAVQLAASSIANGMFFIIFVIGLGISFAISPLVAISVGSQNSKEAGDIFKQGLILNFSVSLLLFASIYWGADLIRYFNQPKAVAEEAIVYLKILSYSAVPMMIFQSYKQFIEGLAIMRPAMFITIIVNLTNAFGNWLLIFGNLGFPKLGLAGAGISTSVNRMLMAVMIAAFVHTSKRFAEFDLSKIKKIQYKVIKRILSLGLPTGFQFFFEVGAFSSAAILIGWIGTKELAAHQIALNLASITFMIATGISAAAAVRVGHAVGIKNIDEIRKAGFSAVILVMCLMSFFALNFILFNNFFPTLYIKDQNVISIASSLLIIAAIFQISDGTQNVGLGILRGLTDAKYPTTVTFIAYWVFGLPTGYLLAFNFGMGVYGVWIGFIVGLTTSASLLVLRFNKKSKRKIDF